MSTTGLPILTYHALDRSNHAIATDPAWFAATMERLVSAGFVGVGLADWIAQGRPEVANGFAVAFDDGLRSILNGVDVLERNQIPATVFLVTDHVGGDNAWEGQSRRIPRLPTLDWSEITELSMRGFSFGAHTATHPRLDRLRPNLLGRELREARDAIVTRLNRPCGLFAYPYGRSSTFLRSRVGRTFDAAFGTRMALADAASPLDDLPRIDAYYLRSPRVLDRLVAGRLRPWLSLRRGLRMVRGVSRTMLAVDR